MRVKRESAEDTHSPDAGHRPHTFEAVNTGKVDSQFGTPIETGQAIRFVAEALKAKNTRLCASTAI